MILAWASPFKYVISSYRNVFVFVCEVEVVFRYIPRPTISSG